MEALGDILEPYSEQIAKFAGGVTCLQFLSGILLMNEIRKKQKSDGFPAEPFVLGVVLTVLTLKLGVLLQDAAMIQVNLFGFVVNILFVFVFYWYASDEFRKTIWSRLSVGGVFTVACLAYSNFESPEKVEFRFGLLITGILIVLVGSPLLQLGEIMRTKSTGGLPFPMIASGTVVSAAWALYGLSIKNSVMTYQNLLLMFLGSIQLSLFVIYPSGDAKKSEDRKPLLKERAKKDN